MVEEQRQHNVEHQEQRVRISGVPSILEHDQDVIVEAEELQHLHGEQRSSVQNENRSRFIHFSYFSNRRIYKIILKCNYLLEILREFTEPIQRQYCYYG